MTRISFKQAREMGLDPGPAESKYHSQKVTIDGITFDSQKEANRYCELKLLKRGGIIKDFQLQPEFILLDGYREMNGKWIRPIKYRADFLVTYPDGRQEVIDTKGHRTKDYLIKRKMLLNRYPDINFIEE